MCFIETAGARSRCNLRLVSSNYYKTILETYNLSSLALTPGAPTPLRVYVRGYAIRTRVVCRWVCVGG